MKYLGTTSDNEDAIRYEHLIETQRVLSGGISANASRLTSVEYLGNLLNEQLNQTGKRTSSLEATLSAHTSNKSNPHSVTKAQVGLGNVENTALSTWTGSARVTTLGTITTGTWNGSAIDVAHGGTGKTSFTANSVIMSGASSDAALVTRSVLNQSGSAQYINPATDLVTANTVAYWDGSYDHSGSSNITHVGVLQSLTVSGELNIYGADSEKTATIYVSSVGNLGISPYGDLEIDGNTLPDSDGEYTLGSSSRRWSDVYSSLLNTSGQASVGSLLSGAGITAYANGSQTAGSVVDSIPTDSTLSKTEGVLGVSASLLARIEALEAIVSTS